MLGLSMLMMYAYHKQTYERDRLRMWMRREHLQDMPAHHFSNRGGVLIEKQFVGFEKYHSSDKSLMDWYKKTNPGVNFDPVTE
jgi:hypothetical protein